MEDNIEFDYKSFATNLSHQCKKLIPEEIKGEDRVYIVNKVAEYSNIAGETLYNDESITCDLEEYAFLVQIIAEWTFHKSIDLIKGGIDVENREFVLQKIAYKIITVIKECIKLEVDRDSIVNTVEHHVNKVYKEVLKELCSEGKISLETYNNAKDRSNIDDWCREQNENRGSFYSADDQADVEYLKEKTLYIYGKGLAYKYLIKAARILKKHQCNKRNRQNILKFLHGCSEYYIDSAINVDFEFDKLMMERLLTVGMEIAFHRIIVMYKNNILNDSSMAKDVIDTFTSIVFAVELNYIKNKDRLKDVYYIANTIYFRELKEYLKDWLEDGKITREQYNHALDKSSLVYLANEISRLMQT